jgi:long-chain fatty acid transport protein
MGGAFAAWADDPTAVYFNPAALDQADPQAMVGGEMVYAPRSYTPLADDGTHGPEQDSSLTSPLPTLGALGRFTTDDQPSRLTMGGGLWNTFGGKATFPKTGMPAFNSLSDVVFEASAGASLRVSNRLSVGGAIRFGFGTFSVDATQKPFDANLSGTGFGLGMALGALVRPTDNTRIGLSWRSPMRVSTSGIGTVATSPGTNTNTTEDHEQYWPQTASLGLGWAPAPGVKLALQVDYAAWSHLHALTVTFPTHTLPDQAYPQYWNDTWTFRAGGDYQLSSTFAVRAGAYFDTNAVPDRTIERQYFDSDKIGLAGGASLKYDENWRFDAAVDFVVPGTRSVPNNTMATMAFPADRNVAPGDYSGMLLQFELAAARLF